MRSSCRRLSNSWIQAHEGHPPNQTPGGRATPEIIRPLRRRSTTATCRYVYTSPAGRRGCDICSDTALRVRQRKNNGCATSCGRRKMPMAARDQLKVKNKTKRRRESRRSIQTDDRSTLTHLFTELPHVSQRRNGDYGMQRALR